MLKNITETIKVPVSFLLDTKELTEANKQDLLTLSNMSEGSTKRAAREAILSTLPEQLIKQAMEFGVELPTDIVELNMKLGDFLFNLYAHNAKPVQAPLLIKRHEKKLLELSDIFSQEEFDVPDYVKEAVEAVLIDPEKWQSTQFSAFINLPDSEGKLVPKYLGLTAVGASVFGKVLNEAVTIFEE